MTRFSSATPKSLGYYFPAEFEKHSATWLSWPHKEASWPGKIDSIYSSYSKFINAIAAGEKVCINVNDAEMKDFAMRCLQREGVNMSAVEFYFHPTNDAWCRDHGPAFVVNPSSEQKLLVIDWGYNAWGNKYPPFDLDDQVPTRVAETLGLPVLYPGIVMEGGSVEFNGAGTVLTSSCCLLNENRNPSLNRDDVERYLEDYYGISQVLWVCEGIIGDDTDGHIDDTIRFVNHDTVLTVVEPNTEDENHELLKRNLQDLKKMRLISGRQLNIVELPMPDPVIYEDQRLPASYANFYIANACVAVPTFRSPKDDIALQIIQECFPDRPVIGIDSTDIIWGLGSFHCLSQQQPAV
jgi:agmatine deiminase